MFNRHTADYVARVNRLEALATRALLRYYRREDNYDNTSFRYNRKLEQHMGNLIDQASDLYANIQEELAILAEE